MDMVLTVLCQQSPGDAQEAIPARYRMLIGRTVEVTAR